MESIEITFNARFTGNILLVDQTGCGETIFVQNLGLHRIFVDIKSVDWISKTKLSKARED